jgi:biuret amidohydrolase
VKQDSNFGQTFTPPVRLGRRTTALLVVDMQYRDAAPDRGFNLGMERIEPGSTAYFSKRIDGLVVPTIRRLIDHFHRNKMTVIFLTLGSQYQDLRDMHPRLRAWIRNFESETGIVDSYWHSSPDFAILAELKPDTGDLVINKTAFGAFNGSQLGSVLSEKGVTEVVIGGVSTTCCVEATARDAADRGYGCVLVDDGCADYDPSAHLATLRAFHLNFGRVASGAAEIEKSLQTGEPL